MSTADKSRNYFYYIPLFNVLEILFFIDEYKSYTHNSYTQMHTMRCKLIDRTQLYSQFVVFKIFDVYMHMISIRSHRPDTFIMIDTVQR